MAFQKMVDMVRTPEEMEEGFRPSLMDAPYYPSGLCLTLTDTELKKLDLEADCEPGDLLHMNVMGKVMSINKNDGGCTISMQIIGMAVEDESAEPVSRMANRYGMDDEEE